MITNFKMNKLLELPDLPVGVYAISNSGELFNVTTNKKLAPSVSNSGYLFYSLTSKHIKYYAHRLVAYAYLGMDIVKSEQRKLSIVVNHKDGNKKNNHCLNLEVVSASQNHKHMRGVLGVKVHNIKLNKEIAKEIRVRISKGEKQNALAKEYKVSPMVISRIKHNIQKEYE